MRMHRTAYQAARGFLLGVVAIASAVLVAAPSAHAELSAAPADTGQRLTRQQVIDALAQGTDRSPANFTGDDLSRLDLSGLDFKQANLTRARLVETNFSHAKMFGVTLTGAVARDADFSNAVLDVAVMRGTDLTHADLRGASLYAAIMIGADLTNADLTKARVIAALTNAKLSGAKLVQTNFGSDRGNQPMGLMFTDFTDSDLSGVDLTGANLEKASLVRANLTGADLTGADVTGANLAQAIFKSIKGRDKIVGMSKARNADQVVY